MGVRLPAFATFSTPPRRPSHRTGACLSPANHHRLAITTPRPPSLPRPPPNRRVTTTASGQEHGAPKPSANAFADSLDWRPFDARASVPMAAALEELGQSVTAASGRTGSRICKGLPLKASAALGRIRVGSWGEGRGVSLRRGGGRGHEGRLIVSQSFHSYRPGESRGAGDQWSSRTGAPHAHIHQSNARTGLHSQ